jgi:hypothetical protein
MKNLVAFFVVLLVVFSCATQDEPVPVTSKQKDAIGVSDGRKQSSARTPEGGGGGTGGTGGTTTSGTELTWNGDGRWHGNFAGTPVWFYGPTPTQLRNGIRGEWPVTCAYYTPGECYPDGFVVYGSGSGFTVQQPACGTITTITLPRYTNGMFSPSTRTITSFTGGNCSIIWYGKVIVNSRCIPMVVDMASDYPAYLCGGGLGVE